MSPGGMICAIWLQVKPGLLFDDDEPTVYINQHFVRTLVPGDDHTAHELISNITHRELWIHTSGGWMRKRIDELERGPVFLDGQRRVP